jgi:prolyl-tRNA synthetase
MIDCGLIKHCNNGTFYILPMLQRSIDKLVRIIDQHMAEIEGQRITMPTLTAAELWKKSGRFENAATELMTVTDQHDRMQILSPVSVIFVINSFLTIPFQTHEESVTSLIASISPVSYKSLPLRLYQITPKFRDELRPKFGLLRAKEFLMKDMYTFDIGLDEARKTYDDVNEQYSRIFQHLDVPFVKISADTGNMGGKISHEYHITTPIGEDSIISCQACSRAINSELAEDGKICGKCTAEGLKQEQGIEIGHTFILEDRYSKVLKATFLNKTGKPENIQMGCYGIGVTRFIAATIELLSSESEIRWSEAIAPYKVCILPPKEGSKEEAVVKNLGDEMYQSLSTSTSLSNDVILDDRTHMTIGKRLKECKKLGFPFIIVIGSKSIESNPTVEVHNLRANTVNDMSSSDAINYVAKSIK